MIQPSYRTNAADPFVGRRLPGLLRVAGLTNIDVHVSAREHDVGHHCRTLLLTFVDNVRDKLLARGLIDEREVAEPSETLRAHLRNPETVVFVSLVVQAWGRKSI